MDSWIDSNTRATSPATSQSSRDLVSQETGDAQQNSDGMNELVDKDSVVTGGTGSASCCGSTQKSTGEIDFAEAEAAELINHLYAYMYGGGSF